MIDLPMLFVIIFGVAIIILGRSIFTKIMDIVLYMLYTYVLEYLYALDLNHVGFHILVLVNVTAYLLAVVTRKIVLKLGLKNS